MKRGPIIVVLVSALFIIFIFVAFALFFKTDNPNSIFISNKTVVNVIDGDTFEYLEYRGDSKVIVTVRLLCVDTPEEGEEGYEEAKAYLESLLMGNQVRLVPSAEGGDKDAYGRELRYVYVKDLFINKLILLNHYGELLIIPPEDCAEMQ
jgi:endonuclease YncB( thermonuclease family)